MSATQPISKKPGHGSATQVSTLEVFFYFLRLGFLGFGGPLALVATMHRDLVEERGWMGGADFARAFALIKAMPGPVAFQTSVFLGRARAGWRGGFAAALGLNGPPFVMMILFGIFYQQWRSAQGGPAFLAGMQAAALGVILASLKSLGFAHRLKPVFWLIALLAIGVTFGSPAVEPLLIVGCGALTAGLSVLKSRKQLPGFLANIRLTIIPVGLSFNTFMFGEPAALTGSLIAPSYFELIWSCFKAGAFVFGSGLAIVPLMEHDFVQKLGWLTHQEFMDALAFGQITPGPVVITATFIGFKTLGLAGAAIATAAIFAAPFFHMMTWFPRVIDKLSSLPWISSFLTGAVGAVVGSIFATAMRLGLTLDMKFVTIPLVIATLTAALFTKAPVWTLIPVGGAIAWLAGLF